MLDGWLEKAELKVTQPSLGGAWLSFAIKLASSFKNLASVSVASKHCAGSANFCMVIDWLAGVFASIMLAFKSWGCDSWAFSFPGVNPALFFLWGYQKENVVYSPPPTTIAVLKGKIRDEIPGHMVKSMMKRAQKMLIMGSRQF